jgi:hypothetical protein
MLKLQCFNMPDMSKVSMFYPTTAYIIATTFATIDTSFHFIIYNYFQISSIKHTASVI